jgi:hypothetical protein
MSSLHTLVNHLYSLLSYDALVAHYNGAFTLDVKSTLNENIYVAS